MSIVVLDVAGVGKNYIAYKSNLQRFASWFGATIVPDSEYWAVRDISFRLNAGEALALIGQNGAGKSTLLKLITGTVQPTTGHIGRPGPISAILELGLGFNPEFTGRQNVYQAGGLLGHSRDLLDQLMPEIESFAEIGEFFDKPIRVYSSGMMARLAFALATAKRPDVLIVDEVLSVGDSYFQHKSFARIRKFKEEGTALLFVTHSMADVRTLCERVILLDKGRVVKDGAPDEVVDYYNAIIAAKENANLTIEQRRDKDGWLLTRSGSAEVAFQTMALVDPVTGNDVSIATVGQPLELRVTAVANSAVPRLVFGVLIKDRTGHVIWGTNTWYTKQIIENVAAGELLSFVVAFTCTLGVGSYSFSPALVSSESVFERTYEWQDNSFVFDVIIGDRDFFVGSSWLDAKFKTSRRGPDIAISPVAG
jgi:lipopolysaccharide transport system ATP-binding protein